MVQLAAEFLKRKGQLKVSEVLPGAGNKNYKIRSTLKYKMNSSLKAPTVRRERRPCQFRFKDVIILFDKTDKVFYSLIAFLC